MTVGAVEINNTEQTPLYYTYKDNGLIPFALPPSLIMMLIATFGHMGNLSIVYVTVKNKPEFYQHLHMFESSNGILDWYSIQQVTILAIDRFFCVLMPMWYRRISKKVYVTSYLVLCLPLIGYILFDAYKMAWEHRQLQVICVVVEGIFPTTLGLYFQCQLIMNAITIGCYVGVWFCQKYRTTIRQETSNRILKSVCAITFVLVIGWTVNAIVQITIGLLLELPQETLFFVELYCGIGPTLACSINYVVLFAFSNDYRTAFKNQFYFNRKTRVTAFVTDTAVQRPTITSSRAPSNT